MNRPASKPTAQLVEASGSEAMHSILIVEDDPITARYLELGLRRMGYSAVRGANSSEMALDMVAAEVPDLVLMDIQIEGGRDGIDTARVLRERYDVPVIFLTGLADAATMERAHDAEPLGYLVKPVKAEDLRAALAAAFQKESLARTARERDCWLGAIVEAIGEPLITCNARGRIEFVNSMACQLLELPADQLLQQPFAECVKLTSLDGERLTDPAKLPLQEIQASLSRPSGKIALQAHAGRVADPRGRNLGHVLVLRLPSEHSALEAEVRRLRAELAAQSLTDELTGMSNRRGFNVLGDQQLKVVRRGRAAATMLLVALQGIRDINDSYGRDAGDTAVRDFASVLRETFREADLIGRLGGGEFAIFAATPTPAEMLKRLHGNLAAHNAGAGRPWELSVKVGMVVHQPKDPVRIPELLDAAARSLKEGDIEV